MAPQCSIGHPMKQQRDHRRHEDKETETATETETETETDRTGSAVQWRSVRAATQRRAQRIVCVCVCVSTVYPGYCIVCLCTREQKRSTTRSVLAAVSYTAVLLVVCVLAIGWSSESVCVIRFNRHLASEVT